MGLGKRVRVGRRRERRFNVGADEGVCESEGVYFVSSDVRHVERENPW